MLIAVLILLTKTAVCAFKCSKGIASSCVSRSVEGGITGNALKCGGAVVTTRCGGGADKRCKILLHLAI